MLIHKSADSVSLKRAWELHSELFAKLPRVLTPVETFHQFKAAIDDCLDKVKSTFSEQINTLLNPKFQLFEKNPQT